jgi:hypothetical protein
MPHKPVDDLDLVSLVAELNNMAHTATKIKSESLTPFVLVSSGNRRTIECFGQTAWDSETSTWDVDSGKSLREYILGHITGKVHSFLTLVTKLCDEAINGPRRRIVAELVIGQRFHLNHDNGRNVWKIETLTDEVVLLYRDGFPHRFVDRAEFTRSAFEATIINGQSVRLDELGDKGV